MARIVVGVIPGMPDAVLRAASHFARRFDAALVCGFVDTSRYVERGEGTGAGRALHSAPIDPDLADDEPAVIAPELAAQLDRVLDGAVPWEAFVLAGDPALALASLADQVDAEMIVVGTREGTMRGALGEFFNGSVAVHLAHRQHRPVVVVPISPVASGPLPWEPR
ncbi:universal stress protein [Herbiconiux sp. 11R-BC]|uniref:universal stress protein n=1 Tax=Herbiconiux sp. 11R-BC TaxID=3111637 RepID=UPI003C0A7F60